MAHQQCTNWIDIFTLVRIYQYIGPFVPSVPQPPLIMLTLGAYWKSPDSEEKSATSGGTCTGGASGCSWDTWLMGNRGNTLKYPRGENQHFIQISEVSNPYLPGFLVCFKEGNMWPKIKTGIFSGGLKGWNFTAFKRLAAFVISCFASYLDVATVNHETAA